MTSNFSESFILSCNGAVRQSRFLVKRACVLQVVPYRMLLIVFSCFAVTVRNDNH